MLRDLFIAKFSWGGASLAKAKLWKETDKTYTIGKAESLFGYDHYYPQRLLKRKYDCFFSKQDALAFLLERSERWVVRCQEQIDSAVEECGKMKELLDCHVTPTENTPTPPAPT